MSTTSPITVAVFEKRGDSESGTNRIASWALAVPLRSDASVHIFQLLGNETTYFYSHQHLPKSFITSSSVRAGLRIGVIAEGGITRMKELLERVAIHPAGSEFNSEAWVMEAIYLLQDKQVAVIDPGVSYAYIKQALAEERERWDTDPESETYYERFFQATSSDAAE